MKRPYISGPMSNIEHHNFPLFYECEADLRRHGYDPINPARDHQDDTWEVACERALSAKASWEHYIRRDVAHVLDADGLVLLPNWMNSRGACLELVLSISIGNPLFVWTIDNGLGEVDDFSLYYDMAVDCLRKFGTISPLDMYNPNRAVVY